MTRSLSHPGKRASETGDLLSRWRIARGENESLKCKNRAGLVLSCFGGNREGNKAVNLITRTRTAWHGRIGMSGRECWMMPAGDLVACQARMCIGKTSGASIILTDHGCTEHHTSSRGFGILVLHNGGARCIKLPCIQSLPMMVCAQASDQSGDFVNISSPKIKQRLG